jgi:hypothetical protein
MWSQTGLIPPEAASGDQPSGVRTRISDQRLIVDLNKPVSGQHSAPVREKAVALSNEENEIAAVRG